MTNYASSRMTMVGPEEEILRFIDTCCGSDSYRHVWIDLVKAVPPPSRLMNADGVFDPPPDDSWPMLNWGTKFIEMQNVEERSDGRLVITYGSAWGPPFVFNRILAERYPQLEIHIACYEMGNDYGYRFHAHGGLVDAWEMGADEALMREVEGPNASDIPSQVEIDTNRAAAPGRLAALRQAPPPPGKRSLLRRILGLR